MKPPYYLLFLCLLGVYSCKKAGIAADNGCISRITQHYISGSDSLTAVNLLKKNNIDNAHLSYYRIVLNDTITNVNSGETATYQHLFALQYFNGLPLFSSYLGFHFKEGVLQFSDGKRYNSIILDTRPSLSLGQLRKLFLDDVSRDTYSVANRKISCLSAEFGYYDLNSAGNSGVTNFIKAWKVNPEGTDYPVALYTDRDGKTIYYFNGLETETEN